MSAFIDLTGRRFGRLLVMQATSKRSSQGDIYWKCVCDCGKSVVVNGKSLRSSGQKSCGCLQREWADSQHNRRTHDGSKDRLFRVWRGMIDRCYYPSHNRYPDYGGRGIYICSEWRHDYAAFREWAMKNGYDANAPRGACTIDRINVDGPYSPENCRWVNAKEQGNYQRCDSLCKEGGHLRTRRNWQIHFCQQVPRSGVY